MKKHKDQAPNERLIVALTGRPEASVFVIENKLERFGAQVIRSRGLFEKATKPGTVAHEEILDVWPDIMKNDGSLKKNSLNELRENPDDAEELDFIVKPEIERIRNIEIEKGKGLYVVDQSSLPPEDVLGARESYMPERVLWVASSDAEQADIPAPIDIITTPVGPKQLGKVGVFHALYAEIAERKNKGQQLIPLETEDGSLRVFAVVPEK